MESVTNRNFGLFIAYVLPGFVAVNGLAFHSPRLARWLGENPTSVTPSLGGFFFLTVSSILCGMLLSTVRWMVVDNLLHRVGVRAPNWNFKKLSDKLSAFETLIEIHYRYYQFHANLIIALPCYCLLGWRRIAWTYPKAILLFLVFIVLYRGARDTLEKYYRRVDDLMDEFIILRE